MQNPPLPKSASGGLVALGPRITGALFLRPALYQSVAADDNAARPGAGIVALAAIAADFAFYSKFDQYLMVKLGQWVFLAIMLLAIARWAFSTALAAFPARLLGNQRGFAPLLRCCGFAQAPGLLLAVPTIAWGFSVPLTPDFLDWTFIIVWFWTLATLTAAARWGAGLSFARALPVAITAHLGSVLFDLSLDSLFLTLRDGVATANGATPLLTLP